MKSRKQRPLVGVSDAARDQQVQQEINAFLQALTSYPDRFAREPYLSFEQYLCSITTGARAALAEERRKS